MNERQRKVINLLTEGFEGVLNTSKWARICKCSQDTALRDIQDLVAKGILQKNESGGRSTNYMCNVNRLLFGIKGGVVKNPGICSLQSRE